MNRKFLGLFVITFLWVFLFTGSNSMQASANSFALLETTLHQAYITGYEDHTIRPNQSITRAETAAMLYRLLTEDSKNQFTTDHNPFTDVNQGQWFCTAVSTLYQTEVLNGYPEGRFSPNKAITRGEFAAIICRFADEIPKTENPFDDVKGHWAEELIAYAAAQHWLTGYPDGSFAPERCITRAEAITIINRALDRGTDHEHMLPDMIQWSDNQLNSYIMENGVYVTDPWFYCAIQEATNSHKYTRENQIEQWTELTKNPQWEQPVKDFYQIVINRSNPIENPENYVPPTGLAAIKGSDQRMETQAAAALETMLRDLRATGLSVMAVSGYRTYERQVYLYQNQVRKVLSRNPGMSQAEAERIAATISAIPGTSEHELGLAIDLSTDGSLTESFAHTAAGKWLYAHCADYGFILRYPADKQEITGIIYEPWHFRYVGIEPAKDIMASGLCMEEYYGTYLSKADSELLTFPQGIGGIE